MKKRTKKKIINILRSPLMGLGYFLILITCIRFHHEKKIQQRKENAGYSNAVIDDFIITSKGTSVSIFYKYTINQKEYLVSQGGANIFKYSTIATQFKGKCFPIIYDTLNPENSMLLMLPVDFSAYNLSYPDSLEWVLPYFERQQ